MKIALFCSHIIKSNGQVYNLLSKKDPIFREEMNCEMLMCKCNMQEVYLRAVGNLSLINHLKRMVGDGIRPLDMMIKAPSVKQEPPIFREERMSETWYGSSATEILIGNQGEQ